MYTLTVTGSMVSVDSERKLIERTGNGDKQGYCCRGQKGDISWDEEGIIPSCIFFRDREGTFNGYVFST